MATIDEKFEKFGSLVLNEAVKKRDEQLEELESIKKARIEEAENEILEKSYKFVQKGVLQARKESNISASKKPAEAKKEVFMYRSHLIDELFDELSDRLVEYKKTADYYSMVCSKIDYALKELNDNNCTLLISKSDDELKDKLSERYGFAIELSDTLFGGVVIRNSELGKVINCSFDEKIEELKSNFLSNVKFTIN